jgi:hypothetical protein
VFCSGRYEDIGKSLRGAIEEASSDPRTLFQSVFGKVCGGWGAAAEVKDGDSAFPVSADDYSYHLCFSFYCISPFTFLFVATRLFLTTKKNIYSLFCR